MRRDPLFEPIWINKLEIKNRFCMPAMQLNMAQDNRVTEQMLAFYAERARGGAGMITVGFATVDRRAGSKMYLGAHDDAFLPGLARLAAAIKENGARACIQLNHAGRYNHSSKMDGEHPVAPSAVPSNLTRETPRALETDEIGEVIESFAQAAGRAKEAGFDAVEILCGTGYLISEFLSPVTNRRTDRYGGSFENRVRFGVEVAQAIRRVVGGDFPLLARVNGNDFMPGGCGTGEQVAFASELVQAGSVDALCINVGWHEARVPQIVGNVPRGAFGYLSREFKRAVKVPVIASHRVHDAATARELIADGMCDMVAMGRALIADSFMPEKTRSGREQQVVHCIACAQGCFDMIRVQRHCACLCNPRAGYELSRNPAQATRPKRVMVVGAGAAGMSAALAAAGNGHQVTLYEQGGRTGGQLHLAAVPPGRHEFSELARDLETQLRVAGVTVVLNREVDEALVEQEKPDHVILATGAKPLTPPIPGADLPNVVQAWDVLANRVGTGDRVVIIGGGAVGVETALYLAEKGTLSGDAFKFLTTNRAEEPEYLYRLATQGSKEVLLVELLDSVGNDIGKSTRWVMMQEMARGLVETRAGTRAVKITPNGVTLEQGGEVREIEADTVVLAVGARPHNPLQEKLRQKGISCEVVGDAGGIALAFDAVHNGYLAGSAL